MWAITRKYLIALPSAASPDRPAPCANERRNASAFHYTMELVNAYLRMQLHA
jgi:hypothetical protein